jgi:phenylacetic acid degradation protein
MALYEFEGRVPRIAPTAYVAPSAQVIGDVRIGKECYVGHGAILRGDYGTIEIGDGTAVEEGAIVHARPGDFTRIGNLVTLGHGCMVHNATIRDRATIGMRATVSDFSEVGEGAIVGEMTLVKQHQAIPARAIAVGIPARVIGEVSEKNRDMTHWAKELYVDLARRYPKGLKEIAECGRAGFRESGTQEIRKGSHERGSRDSE